MSARSSSITRYGSRPLYVLWAMAILPAPRERRTLDGILGHAQVQIASCLHSDCLALTASISHTQSDGAG